MKPTKSIILVLALLLTLGACSKKSHKSSKSEDSDSDNESEMSSETAEISKSDDEIINDYVNSMVFVEGGTFTMGASNQDSEADFTEKPAHSVTLSSFHIGKTEVTQELWEAVMGNNPSKFKGEQRPVENVSWDDCQVFISKLNEKTGKNFRLPTEAEWEYAARGGNKSQHYKFSGSNNIDDVAWYSANTKDKTASSPDYGTHNVATKNANELGIYDMSGNVWEMCSDWKGSYNNTAQSNPQGPTTGNSHVCRGGCWWKDPKESRVTNRMSIQADGRYPFNGLRLAM